MGDKSPRVRVTDGPLKGKTGRLLTEWGDSTHLVQLRNGRLIEISATHVRAL